MKIIRSGILEYQSATNDFAPCLEQLLGELAPLSSSTVVRLQAEWQEGFKTWQQQSLEAEYLCVWVDGVYSKAGPKDEKMALSVAAGVTGEGEKGVLAIQEGYRESAESWRGLFRDLKNRGVNRMCRS